MSCYSGRLLSLLHKLEFLGLVGYYKRFIKAFSNLVFPLNELLGKVKLMDGMFSVKRVFKGSRRN